MIGLLTNIWEWLKLDGSRVFFFGAFVLWLTSILVKGMIAVCGQLLSPFRKQPITIRVTAPQGMNTTELSRNISREVQAVLRPQSRRRTEPPQPDNRPSSLAVVMSDDDD